MNKGDISKVLSLSCVENYFLGYFQSKIDVRLLYTESFVSFNDVVDSFLKGIVSYENYPLPRLQDTSEKLGLTSHMLKTEMQAEQGQLNLIRVNREFFRNSKLLPLRADHYIAIERAENGYVFLNNYPLSDGKLNDDRMAEIYDGACLIYRQEDFFDRNEYIALCELQHERMAQETIRETRIGEGGLTPLRDAMLVLKTLRKRLIEWLQYEGERGRFDDDLSFRLQSERVIKQYEGIIVAVQLQIVRKQTDIEGLREKLTQLCEQETAWNKAIKNRRI